MWFWPNLELTEYEKRFVSPYKTDKKPGVLRRTYRVLLNSLSRTDIPGLESLHLEGAIQIARRSRIFGLTFGGDTQAWRLNISTASGETFTPRFAGGQDPMVSAMIPGVMWNVEARDMNGPKNLTTFFMENQQDSGIQFSPHSLPLIVDPNWELSPNEQLIFRGTPIVPPGYDPLSTMLILEIGIHAWEFPGMVIGAEGPMCAPRTGQGPSLGKKGK